MTEAQFIDAVLEHIFVQGMHCPNLSLLSMCLRTNKADPQGPWDPIAFAQKCIQEYGIAHPAVSPVGGLASRTAGARDQWLAVHEAGHAIVGIKAGFALRGVRFYGAEGFPGEAGLEDVEWQGSRDEDLLRRLIRVDVAGNIAQMLYPGCEAPLGGRLSELYKDRTPGDRPTDFISADMRAAHLTVALAQWNGKPPVPAENWVARREILARAETEAEQVLQPHMKSLSRLAEQLLHGPMLGSAVRAILEG
jgi:hypothetical protein